jgi:O-glycosyl hydrolase
MEPANDDSDPAHVNAAGFVRPDNDPRQLAEFFSVYLSYLEEAGHSLDSLSIQNEPEATSPWDANIYTPPRMGNVLEAVAQRIVADGHSTRLHGPDDAIADFVPIYLPALLAKPTVASLFHAVGFHLYGATFYPDSSTVAAEVAPVANAAPPEMPLWMTEFSNTTLQGYGSHDEGIWQAELIHESLVNGVSMYVMWNLYRPGGPGEAAIVIPTTPGAHGYTVTPKYWTLRQYAKYVRAGALRIEASSDDADLLVTAFRDDAAGKLVAVAINRADAPRWAVFKGANLSGAPEVVRTSQLESGASVSLDSFDRFADRALLMPARSVATLIWMLDPWRRAALRFRSAVEVHHARERQRAESHAQCDAVPAERRESMALQETDQPAHRDRGRYGCDREAEQHRRDAELLEQVRRAGVHRREHVLQQLVAARRAERRHAEQERELRGVARAQAEQHAACDRHHRSRRAGPHRRALEEPDRERLLPTQ